VLPFAGHVGAGEGVGLHGGEELDHGLGLGGRGEFALVALDVFLMDQAFNGVGARGGSAETAFFHGVGHGLVIDEFAGALHGGEERGFRVARRRLGRLGVERGGRGDGLGVVRRGERGEGFGVGRVVVHDCLIIYSEPAGRREDLAFGFEIVAGGDGRDARGDVEFGGREERRDETAGDHIVDLGLHLIEVLGFGGGRDDRKVVGDLRVVEDALVGLQPTLV